MPRRIMMGDYLRRQSGDGLKSCALRRVGQFIVGKEQSEAVGNRPLLYTGSGLELTDGAITKNPLHSSLVVHNEKMAMWATSDLGSTSDAADATQTANQLPNLKRLIDELFSAASKGAPACENLIAHVRQFFSLRLAPNGGSPVDELA